MILDKKHEMQRKLFRQFAETEFTKEIQDELDETGEFNWDMHKKMARYGFMGVKIPKEYGGAGADSLTYALMVEELARVDAVLSIYANTSNSLGGGPLLLGGNEAQKQKYLPAVASGEKIMVFGLTEPGAGSDAGGTTTTAIADGDDFIINGRKCFISGAPMADWAVVFAKTDPEAGAHGITGFLIDGDTPGLAAGAKEHKMGFRLSDTTEVVLENVRVPRSAVIGEVGCGMSIALNALNLSRAFISTLAVGIMQRALDEAVAYAKQRKQFGVSVSTFQSVQNMLADMEIQVQASRQAYLHAAELMDAGLPFTAEAAIAKTIGTDTGMKCAVDGVQIMGGYGYMKDYPMEKLMRDAKILQIYEGTNQIQRSVIAGQLLKKYH